MTPAQGPFLPIAVDDKAELVPSGQPPPSYQAASEDPPPPAPPAGRDRCRRRFRRFGHFLIATFFVWLAARYIIRHCELRSFARPHPDDVPCGHPPHGFPPGHGGHLPRPGEHIDACVDTADWVETDDPGDGHFPSGFEVWQRAELSLPSSADDIFLISPGFNTGGMLHIVEAADRDDIGVEVAVGSSRSSDLFKRTNLCTLRRGEGGHGVGIFAHLFGHHPRNRDHHRDGSLFFNITVSLPKGKDIATIPRFETHLPKFGHFIGALEKNAFGSICLHSDDSPIVVESLVGDKINICSRNGPIFGTFNTSSSIKIITTNSPVHVSVNAFNRDTHPATRVKLRTSNSFLQANLSLLSTSENQSNGNFVVHARTSNSPLGVYFTQHAPDALLKLEAHTSNSPAFVHLHPSFEGIFKLRTSIFLPDVKVEEEVPAGGGEGKERVVNVKTVGHGTGIVYGDVAWVPQDGEGAPGGKVEVSTSNAPLRLSL